MLHCCFVKRILQAAPLAIVALLIRPAAAAETLPAIQERFARVSADGPFAETPNFQRHVVALLGRLGCNGRNCHGSFQGRGGFRLSMFGYDFAADHESLLAGNPARANPASPAQSLILLKPTDADEHEGGKRYDKDGWEYRVLRAWIAGGAKDDSSAAGALVRLEVTPSEIVFKKAGEQVQLCVVAVWSDGTREDVTCLTRFSTNDDAVAEITPEGLVRAKGSGDTHLIASYDNGVEATSVLLPLTDQIDDKYPAVATPTKIDELIVGKLRKLGVVPSAICTDEEFLRRASLDIAGTLPTPDEVRSFAADPSTEKRRKKVDELLEAPAYALWWSTKFCDVTGLNGPLYLGTTEFGPIMTEHWRSWVERKVRDNVPYDKIVEGMTVSVSRQPGQSYQDYALQMTSYVRKQEPVDFTDRDSMPNFWFRGNLTTSDDKALAFAYSFLGVRLDCAQCHKHPLDRWSQRDFKQFAAIFDRVRWGVSPDCKEPYDQLREDLGVAKMKNAAERRQSYWRWAGEGKIVPWPEVYIARKHESRPTEEGSNNEKPIEENLKPKLLGGEELELPETEDPRRPLMDWLRQKDNPYFAQAFVNRVWAHYFGRGIVEPPDDLNLANPPSNGPLLEYLAAAFVEHGYDMKWLHREITSSDAYRRSWRANDSNRTDDRNFSRALIRRLPAEVAVDAIRMATANSKQAAAFQTVKKDRRIGVQATADHVRTEYSLAVFGKPLRTVNCDCEREQQPSLAQILFVRNDQDLHGMIGRSDGWIAELAKESSKQDKDRPAAEEHEELVRLAYLRALSREPNGRELTRSLQHLERATDRLEGLRDLVWALLNTQEFITNH